MNYLPPPEVEVKPIKLGIIPKAELTREEFEKLFGFLPKEPLTDDERAEMNSVNRLFDYMQDRLGQGSWQIFSAVFEDPEIARIYHSTFLRKVATCPSRVIAHSRKALKFEDGTEE
jgi:hypothetical protein